MEYDMTIQVEPNIIHIQPDDGEPSERDVKRTEIAELAYALWQEREGEGGSPIDDWIEAERRLHEHTNGNDNADRARSNNGQIASASGMNY